MGEFFRSQEMQLVQLFVQFDAAHDTIEELGALNDGQGVIQFIDMNPSINAFMRNFIGEVKRCDEMERKLRFLIDQLHKEHDFDVLYGEGVAALSGAAPLTIDQLEARLEQEEQELISANNSAQLLERNRNELVELKHVLEKDELFFREAGGAGPGAAQPGARRRDDQGREDAPLLGDEDDLDSRQGNNDLDQESFFPKASQSLGFITGVVDSKVFLAFERVLWRATRGNLYLRHAVIEEEIRDMATGEPVSKDVFIIFYQGTRVEQKVRKICDAFKANQYPCPQSAAERKALLAEVNSRLREVDLVLHRGGEVRRAILRRVGLEAPSWQDKLQREKAIFSVMNMMNYDLGRKCLIANGWCPVTATADIQEALRKGVRRTGTTVPSILSVLPSDEIPPTHFKTNKFTAVFQEMVDAYGVPHYGEINPAAFAIATFPFLFAVMYGDVGHGLLMVLCISPLLIWSNQAKELAAGNEIFGMMYTGRYLLFMMSLASIYTGFLYNEFFSIPMNIFGSAWSHETCLLPNCPHGGCGLANDPMGLCKANTTYPFGVDPAFRGAENELNFSNSLKMKMSIVLGVVHMSLGVVMHLLNGIKFRKWYNVFCEVFWHFFFFFLHLIFCALQFVPQLVFLWCMFGYLVVIIFFKWFTDYGYYTEPMAVTFCGKEIAFFLLLLLCSSSFCLKGRIRLKRLHR
jgi:V-type H+-transporting ATPase subunit a